MHQIDYRDHIFSQKSLFFLEIPDLFFDFFFKNTGMWVNRLRHSQWIDLFKTLNNLKTIKIDKQISDLPLIKKQSQSTTEDTETTSALFILKKYAD